MMLVLLYRRDNSSKVISGSWPISTSRLAREPIECLAGAVGRAIVDEEDVRRERQRQELLAQPVNVAILVVGRHEDQAARDHGRPTPGRRRWKGAGTAAVHPPRGTRPHAR